jgi:hypothetical protein
LSISTSLKWPNWSLKLNPKESFKEVANCHYTWVDLLNILDLEGLHVQMLSLVGTDLLFTWSVKVVYVGCALLDYLNLLDLEGLPTGMFSLFKDHNLPFTSKERKCNLYLVRQSRFSGPRRFVQLHPRSLVGSNLPIRFCCSQDFDGLIVLKLGYHFFLCIRWF